MLVVISQRAYFFAALPVCTYYSIYHIEQTITSEPYLHVKKLKVNYTYHLSTIHYSPFCYRPFDGIHE